MWQTLLARFLNRMIRSGCLTVVWPDGRRTRHGAGSPEIAITLHDTAIVRALVLNPEMALGEGYTDGLLTIEQGDLRGLLGLAASNANAADYGRFGRAVPTGRSPSAPRSSPPVSGASSSSR